MLARPTWGAQALSAFYHITNFCTSGRRGGFLPCLKAMGIRAKKIMNVPPAVFAEHPVIWKPAPQMPDALSLVVLAQTWTEQTGLVLDLHITVPTPPALEWWRLAFLDHTASKVAPVGAPENASLASSGPISPLYVPPISPFLKIQQSAWLPGCGTHTIAPARLHHYLVYAAAQKRAVHVAALGCVAWRLKEGEELESALYRSRIPAVVEASPQASAQA